MIGQKQADLEEITHHTEDIQCIVRSSGAYFRVYLPDKISEFEWEKDDYLLIEEVDETPSYLRAEKAVNGENTERSSNQELRKIITQGSSRLRLQIPPQWSSDYVDYDERVEEVENSLVVEVNDRDNPNHLRIYRNEEYFTHRIPELAEQEGIKPLSGESAVLPVLGGVVNRLSGGYTDLAADIPFEGQKFQVIPFNGLDEIWIRKNAKDFVRGEYHPSILFDEVRKEQGVSRMRVKKLKIYWDPSQIGNPTSIRTSIYSGSDGESIKLLDSWIEIFSKSWTKGCNVVLPAQGRYIFRVESRYGRGTTWTTYLDNRSLNRTGWRAAYSDIWEQNDSERDEETPISIFIPTPNIGEHGKAEISWHWD